MEYHKQCVLKSGVTTDIMWIPERFAVVGKRLQDEELESDRKVWVVESVGEARQKMDQPNPWIMIELSTCMLDVEKPR